MIPGIRFSFDAFKTFVLPPLLAHGLLRLYSTQLSVAIPTFVYASVWFFTLPIYWKARSKFIRIVHAREARKLGVEVLPEIHGKWPGNLDILINLVSKKHPYIGDGLLGWRASLGSVFSLSTLADSRVITSNPENVKQVLATNFDNYVKGKTFNE